MPWPRSGGLPYLRRRTRLCQKGVPRAGDGRARSARGAGAGWVGPRSRRDRKSSHSGSGELGESRFSFLEVVGEEASLSLVVLDDVVADQVAQQPGTDDLQEVGDGHVRDARLPATKVEGGWKLFT